MLRTVFSQRELDAIELALLQLQLNIATGWFDDNPPDVSVAEINDILDKL